MPNGAVLPIAAASHLLWSAGGDRPGSVTLWRHVAPAGRRSLPPVSLLSFALRLRPGQVALRRADGTVATGAAQRLDGHLILPGEPLCWTTESPSDNIHVDFPRSMVAEAAAAGVPPPRAPCFLLRDRQAARLTVCLAEAVRQTGPHDPLYVDTLARALLLRLLGRTPPAATAIPARIRCVLDLIHGDPSAPLSLAALARAAGCSPFHLARRFRAEVGIPPHAYITAHRLLRAESLLRGGASVTEAALAVGFSNPAHLAALFRRHRGVLPAALRGSARTGRGAQD